MVNFVLMIAILILVKIAYNMHRRIELKRHTIDCISSELRRRIERQQAIRAEEQARTGVYHLETDDNESEEKNKEIQTERKIMDQHGSVW